MTRRAGSDAAGAVPLRAQGTFANSDDWVPDFVPGAGEALVAVPVLTGGTGDAVVVVPVGVSRANAGVP